MTDIPFEPILALLLKQSDVIIRHIADGYEENPDEITKLELDEFIMLREQVEHIYINSQKEQEIVKSIPAEITRYLKMNNISAQISIFNEKPLQYLVESSSPLPRHIADGLEELWPDIIVLNEKPI
jgi:hypothetical protein